MIFKSPLLQAISTMACGLALLVSAVPSGAQTYPARPIKLVVPFPPGGGTDVIAREIANKVAATNGWSIVVDNKPGSGGNLGVDVAAKAQPDGYTLVLGQTSNLAINPSLYSKLPYNVEKDLVPVVYVATSALAIVVAANSPFKTMQEVVAASKAKPESINYGSSGSGTVSHLAIELFQRTADIKMTHVPYRGAAQGLTDLFGGQIQTYVSSVPTLIGHIKNGKMRALAVTSKGRSDDLPTVPSIAELGYKDFDATTWFGVLGPAGMPKDVIAKLNAAFNKALQDPVVKEKLAGQGADVTGGTPEQFGAYIKVETARWSKIVKESGAKVD